jgi:hypothetical protein
MCLDLGHATWVMCLADLGASLLASSPQRAPTTQLRSCITAAGTTHVRHPRGPTRTRTELGEYAVQQSNLIPVQALSLCGQQSDGQHGGCAPGVKGDADANLQRVAGRRSYASRGPVRRSQASLVDTRAWQTSPYTSSLSVQWRVLSCRRTGRSSRRSPPRLRARPGDPAAPPPAHATRTRTYTRNKPTNHTTSRVQVHSAGPIRTRGL